MKKLLPLLLFPLLLTSCGDSIYGEYSFVMGKPDDDSHFGITLELLKLKYKTKEGINAQRLILDFDLSEGMIPEQPDPKVDPIGAVFYVLLGDIIKDGVNGCYWLNGDYEDKGTLVNIGVDAGLLEIPDDVVQKIFFAYLDYQSTMNFVMPCSIEDLQMQLCWYGIYIDNIIEQTEEYVKLDTTRNVREGDQVFLSYSKTTHDELKQVFGIKNDKECYDRWCRWPGFPSCQQAFRISASERRL